MRAHLRAGAAVFNEGRYHAAHDAWEDRWLALDAGTNDEQLLHGLIQYTALVHHADEGNADGVAGLAESASAYLADLPDDYRGVDLPPIRAFLDAAGEAPADVAPADAPPLVHEGAAPTYDDLRFEATAVAARVLAEAGDYDERILERAIGYARNEDAAAGTFTGLLFGFVRDAERRDTVYARLDAHVARERSRETDVDGLFEERDGE